jgi:hypothetical protein
MRKQARFAAQFFYPGLIQIGQVHVSKDLFRTGDSADGFFGFA